MSLTALLPPTLPVAPSKEAASPLPLPVATWGAPEAVAALEEARAALPVRLPAVTVVSALTTVVLRAGDHAVKVYPPGTDPAHLDRVACALAGSATAHLPLGPAVPTLHGVVTVAPWLPPARPVSWAEVGTLLRAFHDEHAEARLADWTPLSRLPSQVEDLPGEYAAVLMEARARLLGALEEVGSVLGEGAIHGDVSLSNVMRTASGPRLIDLDWAARGPREYDLASAARRVRNGEISRRTYHRFCAGYGYDVLSWPGLTVLDRIADLGGVAFRIWDSRHHGLDLDWLAHEAAVWRAPL